MLAFAGACLGLFVWLAMTISSGAVGSFDEAVRSGIHHFPPPISRAWHAVSASLGSGAVIASLFVIAFVGFYATRATTGGDRAGGGHGGRVVLENALKFALHRARPEPFFGTPPETYSFPSGHALFSACFYAALAWTSQRGDPKSRSTRGHLGGFAGLIAAIGLSRLYLGIPLPDRCDRGISRGCLLDNGAACIAGRPQR